MNVGIEKNLEIALVFCLNPNGCPLQSDCKTYDDRQQKCSACRNKLEKVDLVDLLNHLYKNGGCGKKANRVYKGKNTELSKVQIENILSLHSDGYSINKISEELHLQFRTVKNVINLSFKNALANEKVQNIKNEMGL